MSWIKKSLLSIAGVTLLFFLMEFMISLVWINPFSNSTPSKVVELRMQSPNTERSLDRSLLGIKGDNVLFRVDANRFIVPSNQYKKPEKTIMFMGGSTTECSAVEEDKRFPNYVSTLFAKEGRRINTINLGRSGNTLQDTINIFFNDAHTFQPDYLVVMHATNDIGVLEHDPLYRSRLSKTVDLKDMFKWVMQKFSTTHFGGLIRVVYANFGIRNSGGFYKDSLQNKSTSINHEAFELRLEVIIDMARAFKIEPLLMTQPLSDMRNSLTPHWSEPSRQALFNKIIRDVASRKKVTLIDLANHMQQLPDVKSNPLDYWYDGMHVTDLGSEEYARYIYKRLSDVL